ncbi:MAG: YbaB/EbfC family nucleoid-associated protein [Patescibacteria group bacterium]
MFDQLKQLKQMKDLQDKISKEKAEFEKEGIKVIVNGKMEVEEITLNPSLDKGQQEKILKDCINEAMRKVQMSAAQKLFQSGGLN